jgi:serine protease Do
MAITDEMGAVAARLRQVTVRVQVGGSGEGAGVLWHADGLVLTNAHVARGTAARVLGSDGATFDARVVARDAASDLAALRIVGDGSATAELGDVSTLRPGALVLALGHPLGVSNALALGIVHHIATDATGEPRWIRADIRLAPGNSGGPLADASGRIVGINTLVAGGLGYAVPLTMISRFLHSAGLSAPGRRAA